MSLSADIYSYSRSKGAYAGATLGGAGIETDKETNQAYYGKALTANDILFKGKAVPPASAKNLIAVIEKFGPKEVIGLNRSRSPWTCGRRTRT